MNILDNIASADSSLLTQIVDQAPVFDYLFRRMNIKKHSKLDENKLYCSELLAIYTHMGDASVKVKYGGKKGLEKTLICLLPFAKRDPEGVDEIEYVSNLLSAASAGLMESANKKRLLDSGKAFPKVIEFVKTRKFIKLGSLKILDFALMNHPELCNKFVELNGLKTLFAAFMKGKPRKRYKQEQADFEEHINSIMVQLFMNLHDVALQRFVNKFRENDYEKIERLAELHGKYIALIETADKHERRRRLQGGHEPETAVERYERNLDNGLFTLQNVDLTIGFVSTSGDSEMRSRVEEVMNRQDMDLEDVKPILREYAINLGKEKTEANVPLEKAIYAVLKLCFG